MQILILGLLHFPEHSLVDAIFTARLPNYMSTTFVLFLYILANGICIAGI